MQSTKSHTVYDDIWGFHLKKTPSSPFFNDMNFIADEKLFGIGIKLLRFWESI